MGMGLVTTEFKSFYFFNDKSQVRDNTRHWILTYAGMTVVVEPTVKFLPSSRRRSGSSVFAGFTTKTTELLHESKAAKLGL